VPKCRTCFHFKVEVQLYFLICFRRLRVCYFMIHLFSKTMSISLNSTCFPGLSINCNNAALLWLFCFYALGVCKRSLRNILSLAVFKRSLLQYRRVGDHSCSTQASLMLQVLANLYYNHIGVSSCWWPMVQDFRVRKSMKSAHRYIDP
jgi:hypothetical protein